MKKPVNNFSEDELYPPKVTPVHNPQFPPHTATTPLSHKHISAVPASPLADLHPASSLPAHLTSMISSPSSRHNGETLDNQVTGTEHKSESHSESNDAQHNGSVPKSSPQSVEVEAPAVTNTSEMTHHRNNSDFFVTPSSSPPASPKLPLHTHAHTRPNPARVGNRAPSREVRLSERILDTFFSRVPTKFEDLLLVESSQIPTAEFLECCRTVVPFFGEFSFLNTYSR